MKTLTLLAVFAALAIQGAETPKTPTIQTSRFWRLVAQAQNLRLQANQTPAAKAADAADEAVKKEQDELAKACGDFVLGYDQNDKSPTFQDVICVPKPPPTTAETKREK